MSDDADNPFEAPRVFLSPTDGQSPRPAVGIGSLLLVLGGLVSIYGLGLLSIETRYRFFEQGPQSIYFIIPLIGGILSLGCGVSWLISALCCFKQRLRVAGAMAVIGAGLFIAFFLLVYLTLDVE